MQHANLASRPSFDFRAFVAWSAGERLLRAPQRSAFAAPHYPMLVGVPAAGAEPGQNRASARWVAELHIAAARRWLACVPVRADQVEASLRDIETACQLSHPLAARAAREHADLKACDADTEALLARLQALIGDETL